MRLSFSYPGAVRVTIVLREHENTYRIQLQTLYMRLTPSEKLFSQTGAHSLLSAHCKIGAGFVVLL